MIFVEQTFVGRGCVGSQRESSKSAQSVGALACLVDVANEAIVFIYE